MFNYKKLQTGVTKSYFLFLKNKKIYKDLWFDAAHHEFYNFILNLSKNYPANQKFVHPIPSS